MGRERRDNLPGMANPMRIVGHPRKRYFSEPFLPHVPGLREELPPAPARVLHASALHCSVVLRHFLWSLNDLSNP